MSEVLSEVCIRTYRPEDESAFKSSIATLQDYERRFSDDMLPGDHMVDAWFEHTMEENRKNQGVIYVAEVDGNPVGFMSVRVKQTSPEEEIYVAPSRGAHVTDLQVLPEHRGKGIGKGLLKKADSYAKEKGLGYVILEVFAENKQARGVYEAQGFNNVVVTMVKPVEGE